jgi:hypothetical protein
MIFLGDQRDQGLCDVDSSMLGKIVFTRELLAALVTFEGPVFSVDSLIVSLEMLLASKSAVA